jgi:hypothetical protein
MNSAWWMVTLNEPAKTCDEEGKEFEEGTYRCNSPGWRTLVQF